MRLPRRVPWASVAELDQVCAWIYQDEHDLQAKKAAINKVNKKIKELLSVNSHKY
jgi:ribosomal biogenesis protein LAS1